MQQLMDISFVTRIILNSLNQYKNVGSDEDEGENDQQKSEQYSDIIPEQSKQKEQNQNLSTEQIQQMEEQLKKIQIFIQVLSACDNISQPNECSSPSQQIASMGMTLPLSFENLNINSPQISAQQSEKQPNKNQGEPNQMNEINTFSLQSYKEENKKFCADIEQKTPNSKSQKNEQIFSSNVSTIKYSSIFKIQNENDEQEYSSEESQVNNQKCLPINSSNTYNSGGIIQNKLKMNNNDKKNTSLYNQMNEDGCLNPQQQSQQQKYNNKSSCSTSVNVDNKQNQIKEDLLNLSSIQPNNSINYQNTVPSISENQKQKNPKNNSLGHLKQDNSPNLLLSNIPLVSDNIDIEADFTQIKNLQNSSSRIKNSSNSSSQIQIEQQQKGFLEQKNPIILPIVSPSQDNIKTTPSFSVDNSPVDNLKDIEIDFTPLTTNESAFKLEPSFFVYFMKKYGKYFDDSLSQTPKLSDLVNMNSQQFEQDCVIEEYTVDNNRRKSSSISTYKSENSPVQKRYQAAERAQNFMDLEDDYGSNELPIIRKKQNSFSAYSNSNKVFLNSLSQSNKKVQSYKEDKNSSPLIEKYYENHIIQSPNKEKKKVKTTEYTTNPLLTCLNQPVEQNNEKKDNQAK